MEWWPKEQEWSVLWLSCQVALLSMVMVLPAGLMLAHLLARSDFPGKGILNGLVIIPLVLPPVVTGYLLLYIFRPSSPLSELWSWIFGHPVAFHFEAAVLASAVVALPLFVRAVRPGLNREGLALEQAAATLGANRLRVLLTITWPRLFPAIVGGLILAGGRSLGEFGATIAFAGSIPGETRTLPLAVYAYMQTPDGETAAMRLIVFSLVISMLALGGSEWFLRRSER